MRRPVSLSLTLPTPISKKTVVATVMSNMGLERALRDAEESFAAQQSHGQAVLQGHAAALGQLLPQPHRDALVGLRLLGLRPRGDDRHVFSMRKANAREISRFAPHLGL